MIEQRMTWAVCISTLLTLSTEKYILEARQGYPRYGLHLLYKLTKIVERIKNCKFVLVCRSVQQNHNLCFLKISIFLCAVRLSVLMWLFCETDANTLEAGYNLTLFQMDSGCSWRNTSWCEGIAPQWRYWGSVGCCWFG